MRGAIAIPADVRDVLSRSTTEGNIVRLPAGQLERSLYAAVDKVLKALGGKWDRRAGGHVFARGIEGALADALNSGSVIDQKKALEQFFTPPEVAAIMFDAVALTGDDHVLEPSAGAGILLGRALQLGCLISAVEKDEQLAKALVALIGHRHGVGLWHADFTEWKPIARAPITKVLMNPPFSRGQDMAHVQRAFGFLAPSGVLAAIMSTHWTFGPDRQSREFRDWAESNEAVWSQLPEASFRASGTGVNTGMLVIRKPGK